MYTQTYIYTYNSMTYYLYIYTTYTQIYYIYICLLYPAIVGYCTLASKGSGELPEFPFAQQVLGGERCKCKSLGRLCLRPPFKGGVPPRSASKAAFATQADNKERQQPHMPLHPPQRHTSPPPTEVKTRTETRECQIAQEPRCVQPNNREEQCRSKNVATACVAVVSNIRHDIHQFKMYTYIYISTHIIPCYIIYRYTLSIHSLFFSYIYMQTLPRNCGILHFGQWLTKHNRCPLLSISPSFGGFCARVSPRYSFQPNDLANDISICFIYIDKNICSYIYIELSCIITRTPIIITISKRTRK